MWRNWQTHKTKDLMKATSCRFKSCHPHHTIKGAQAARHGLCSFFYFVLRGLEPTVQALARRDPLANYVCLPLIKGQKSCHPHQTRKGRKLRGTVCVFFIFKRAPENIFRLTVQKQVKQGSQKVTDIIDLLVIVVVTLKQLTQYNDAYARLKKIFGKKDQPAFRFCKSPLGYLLILSRVATRS